MSIQSSINPNMIHKGLTVKERKELGRIISGNLSPDTNKAQKLLNKPHVAIAFEALLEKHNLSDDRLLSRLAAIIKRKPAESISDKGVKTTNITAVDANAKDTIRLLWQIQGRFVEKHEVKTELSKMEDTELDSIINSGMQFLSNKGKVSMDNRISDLVNPDMIVSDCISDCTSDCIEDEPDQNK